VGAEIAGGTFRKEIRDHRAGPRPVPHFSRISRDSAMNQNVQHSGAWVTFTYASFGAAAFMVAAGVYFLPVDLWIKGYLAMGILMLIQCCVTLTKTVRDVHESSRMVNRIEDAKAERLLMEVNKAA
jgi:hypothetical protein